MHNSKLRHGPIAATFSLAPLLLVAGCGQQATQQSSNALVRLEARPDVCLSL
jgi:hypothetical protein